MSQRELSYVIVEEEGEYSSFSYTILGVYDNLNKAQEAVASLRYRLSFEHKLAALMPPAFREQKSYEIYESHKNRSDIPADMVPQPQKIPFHLIKDKSTIENELGKALLHAEEERLMQMRREAREREKQLHAEKKDIEDFIRTYTGDRRIPSYVAQMAPVVAIRTGDPELLEWVRSHLLL